MSQTPHILICDDDPIVHESLSLYLDSEHYTHSDAYDGAESLQKVEESKPDLILLDVMMPELDGIRTYEMSLNDPDNKNLNTPMIMMTANALSGVREEYLSKGFADYISKPVEIKELLRVVERHLPGDKVRAKQA